MNLFEKKTFIITGAASGIGRATALAFAREGANVVVADADEEGSLKTVHLIEDNNGVAFFVGCDVSNEGDVNQLVSRTLSKFGSLQGAFNNAGTEGMQAPTIECTAENWSRTIDINLKGVWQCMKSEIPALVDAGGGAIVNCSSIAGLRGFENIPAYVASKHGVIGLTRTAALEYGKDNIRINAVCPGPIHTPMLERFTEGHEDELGAKTPMGRVGSPLEVAEAVIWLCSHKASYVTGESLAVDGGWLSR